jgi:hypothetical protein
MTDNQELQAAKAAYDKCKAALSRFGMATASLLLSGACGGISCIESLPFANWIRIVAGVLFVIGIVLYLRSTATMKTALETLYSKVAGR